MYHILTETNGISVKVFIPVLLFFKIISIPSKQIFSFNMILGHIYDRHILETLYIGMFIVCYNKRQLMYKVKQVKFAKIYVSLEVDNLTTKQHLLVLIVNYITFCLSFFIFLLLNTNATFQTQILIDYLDICHNYQWNDSVRT